MEKHYQKGYKYEFGQDTKKDYLKAYEQYKISAKQGNKKALKKIKYRHFNCFQAIYLILSIVIGIFYDFKADYAWFGLFSIGFSFGLSSLLTLNKYWIKTGYANIINNINLYLGLVVLIPISVIKPYLNGITWMPVVLLMIVGLFTMTTGIILFLTEYKKNMFIIISIGLILFVSSIFSFGYETPDKLFSFELVDDGISIKGYRSLKKTIKIPEKLSGYDVVEIADYAFYNLQIEEIVLSDSLKRIGDYAFANNRELKTIYINDGVKIGQGLFASNHNLNDVRLPSDIDVIPDKTFSNNFSLTEYTIHDNIKYIGEEAFYNTNLTSIDLPHNLLYLGNRVFSKTNIVNLDLPESLKSIGSFEDMKYLEEINIPKNINYLSDNFLKNNEGIEHFTVPAHVTNIGEFAFSNTKIKTIDLHNNINEIEESAFSNTNNLNEINIPRSINKLSTKLFYKSNLKEIYIPENIKNINDYVFSYNKNLESVLFEEGLITLGNEVFSNTSLLEQIYLPNSVISIGTSVFRDAIGLREVSLSKNITIIPERSFDGAINLKEITNIDNIKSINKYSFRNTNLKDFILPKNVKVIDEYAFFGIKTLETFIFNDIVEIISTNSFAMTQNLNKIVFPNSLHTIKDYAYNGSGLNSIFIPNSVNNIGYWAFKIDKEAIITYQGDKIPDTWHKNWNPNNLEVILLN